MSQHICVIPECNKTTVGRGWCRTHYSRWQRHGDPLGAAPKKQRPLICAVEGCDRGNHKRGLCQLHYDRERATGSVGQVGPLKQQGSVVNYITAEVPSMTPDTCVTTWPFSFTKGRPSAWNAEARRTVGAVHYAWFVLHGRWPGQLNHTCHDGLCWNPHHVYEGTREENVRDMMEAGRHGSWKLRGPNSPGAKFTCEQVREIRANYQGRYGERKALVERYGVCDHTIYQLLRGDSYRDC